MSETISFSASRKSQTYEVEGQKFTLTEFNGIQRDAFIALSASRVKFEKGENKGISDYTNLKAQQVAVGLTDMHGNPVPVQVIQEWPARVSEHMHGWIIKNSGLSLDGKDEGKEAKNA